MKKRVILGYKIHEREDICFFAVSNHLGERHHASCKSAGTSSPHRPGAFEQRVQGLVRPIQRLAQPSPDHQHSAEHAEVPSPNRRDRRRRRGRSRDRQHHVQQVVGLGVSAGSRQSSSRPSGVAKLNKSESG